MPGVTSEDPPLVSGPSSNGWLTITRGWRLLDDRLGIEVTIENPEHWDTGSNRQRGGAALPAIRGIAWLATPTDATNFLLRLTDGDRFDQRLAEQGHSGQGPRCQPDAICPRTVGRWKGSLPILHAGGEQPVLRHSERHQRQTVPTARIRCVCRDDTAAAKTHAEQLRSLHEFPTLAGSATVPFLTDYYQIGDRVKIVQGRNASLQINVGIDQGETPTYPWITAFAWDFQGDCAADHLQFSDRRAEPQDLMVVGGG